MCVLVAERMNSYEPLSASAVHPNLKRWITTLLVLAVTLLCVAVFSTQAGATFTEKLVKDYKPAAIKISKSGKPIMPSLPKQTPAEAKAALKAFSKSMSAQNHLKDELTVPLSRRAKRDKLMKDSVAFMRFVHKLRRDRLMTRLVGPAMAKALDHNDAPPTKRDLVAAKARARKMAAVLQKKALAEAKAKKEKALHEKEHNERMALRVAHAVYQNVQATKAQKAKATQARRKAEMRAIIKQAIAAGGNANAFAAPTVKVPPPNPLTPKPTTFLESIGLTPSPTQPDPFRIPSAKGAPMPPKDEDVADPFTVPSVLHAPHPPRQ